MLVATFALGTIATGCGGDGNGDAGASKPYQVEASTTMDPAQPPVTKAQFRRRMNRTCRQGWVTVIDNWNSYKSTQDPKLSEKKSFEDAVAVSLLGGIDFYIFDNFRILGSPAGEERRIEAIIGPFQEAVELGWKYRWRASSIDQIVPRFQLYNERARRYGLDDCLVIEAHLRPIET